MIGIFGGTFNPIHFGHLRSVLEITETLKLSEMHIVPCGRPPHREEPATNRQQRLEMVQLAIAGEARLSIDDTEINRPGPSYTVDTLSALRDEVGEKPVCLLLGVDAFLGLEAWHHWRQLTDLAHLVVMHRPGWLLKQQGGRLSQSLQQCLEQRQIQDIDVLNRQPSGMILMQAVTQLEISSSHIRTLVAQGKTIRYLVPEAVRVMIEQQGLYK